MNKNVNRKNLFHNKVTEDGVNKELTEDMKPGSLNIKKTKKRTFVFNKQQHVKTH